MLYQRQQGALPISRQPSAKISVYSFGEAKEQHFIGGSLTDLPDNEAMAAVRDGDLEKLAMIFERYNRRLYAFFVRQTADTHASEDLVQDVFHRILRYRHTYREGGRFSAWIFTIARSALLTHQRKRRHAKDEVPLTEFMAVKDPSPGADIERREESELIRRALYGLPHDKREALILSRFENMSYEEIAQVAGCAVGTIKARVHRAVKELSRNYRELQNEL
jgi:RNA polymerase sigma-70 factor (ECF subfamily)